MPLSTSTVRTIRRSWQQIIFGVMVAGLVTGCRGLLTVTDPTLIQDSDLANAPGANARRLRGVVALNQSVGNVFGAVAMFTDERMFDTKFPQSLNVYAYLDMRDTARYIAQYGSGDDPMLSPLVGLLTNVAIALPAIRAYSPDSVRGEYLAQMYAFRGFAILQMAEDLCPGFPINEVRDGQSVYSMPYTTATALAYAGATLDTALASGHDSTRFLDLARVLRARVYLDQGQYELANSMAAAVPTDFVYQTDNGAGGSFGGLWTKQSFPNIPQAVGNREGGVGLPFASARDPRVVSVYKQMRYHRTADTVSDSLRDQQKYASAASPVVIASGVEARLIEAEVALYANDPTTWLAKLNELRDVAIAPSIPHLVDPGPATRLDTLFKERAFWLYLTGHRLGDMRRLVHQYGRAVNTVYPSGTHPLGVPYGNAISIPFILNNARQYNPHITTGCGAE